MRGVFALCLVTACGRLNFDPIDPSGDGSVPRHDWLDVDTSGDVACGITTGGELWCWGYGGAANTGNGSVLLQPVARVGEATDWISIDVGGNLTCGRRSDSSLWCWGMNESGAIPGAAPNQLVVAPTRIGTGTWAQVVSGERHACAIDTTGVLSCWGMGVLGVLGTGLAPMEAPLAHVAVVGTDRWTQVATSYVTTCGIQTDNSLWCWGSNLDNQVGDGTTNQRNTPVQILAGRQWSFVATGIAHTCALEAGGAVWCWGNNQVGALGDGTTNARANPARATAVPALTSLSLGRAHACGRTGTEELHCWGLGEHGQLGRTIPYTTTALRVAPLARRFAAGGEATCFIDDAARLSCTGSNNYGQAGAPPGIALAPVRADTRTDWARVFAKVNHGCGLTTTGELLCWGVNNRGELGNGDPEDRQVPTSTSLTASDVALGTFSLGVVRTDGSVGLAGLQPDLVTGYQTPMPYAGPGTTKQMTIGERHGCRITGNDTLSCGGANFAGQLGDGTNMNNLAVGPGDVWLAIEAGYNSTCGITISNQLFCWGQNLIGKLGIGSTMDQSTPQLVTLTGATGAPTQIAIGATNTCARTTTGQLWCWGEGSSGELGNGSVAGSTTPVRVGTDTDWRDIAFGDSHGCAIKTDNTMWCWGHGDRGQIAAPVMPARTTPTQLAGSWTDVAAGAHFTCAIRTDGTRWCFGSNETGELGDGKSWVEQFTVIP